MHDFTFLLSFTDAYQKPKGRERAGGDVARLLRGTEKPTKSRKSQTGQEKREYLLYEGGAALEQALREAV